jgi:hypothetical protein
MTIQQLIDKLKTAIEHGQNPSAKVLAWDPDEEEWAPVTVLLFDYDAVSIYTDEP